MNKLIFISIALFVISCGTDQGQTNNYDYTIVNNSGATIEIIPFNSDGIKDLSKKITLVNGQSTNKKKKVQLLEGVPLSMTELISQNENIIFPKIEIIFSNSKKTVYLVCNITNTGVINCDEPRNIFRKEYNDGFTEIYRITVEDFQNATSCNGDCN